MHLIQLARLDNCGKNDLNFSTQNVAYFNEIVENINNTLNPVIKINKFADVIQLQYITFDATGITIDEFEEIMKSSDFNLQIGACVIITYSFELLIQLNPVIHINNETNKYIIKIPQYFLNEIFLVSAHVQDVRYCFNLTKTFKTINMIFKCKIHDIEKHQTTNNFNIRYQETVSQQFISNRCNIYSMSSELTKGFFIIGDISNIRSIECIRSNYVLYYFNDLMIQLYSHKISNNMIYISFEGSNNFENETKESYDGAINMLTFSITYNFSFYKNNNSQYSIHELSARMLYIRDGGNLL